MGIASGITCSSSHVPIKLYRVFKDYAYRETFTTHQGLSISGSAVYSQPSYSSYSTYTWETCLLPGAYTLRLRNTYTYGWYSGSELRVYIDGIYHSTYRLASSYTSYSYTINVKGVYPSKSLYIERGSSVSIQPNVQDCSNPSFSVYSGSLPSGLILDSTGWITGIPTSVVNQRSVTIRVTCSSDSIQLPLYFTVFDNPSTCSSNKVLITISRTVKDDSVDENFAIYKGSSTSGSLVFSQYTILDYHSYIWTVCLDISTHTIQLSSSESNGWSANSEVTLSSTGSVIGSYTLSSGATTTHQFIPNSPPYSFSYPRNPLVISTANAFSISPSVEANPTSFQITSGTLPPGLLLNQMNGTISGIPSTPVTNSTVTVMASNYYGNTTIELQFTVFTNPASCPSGKVLVSLVRQTDRW